MAKKEAFPTSADLQETDRGTQTTGSRQDRPQQELETMGALLVREAMGHSTWRLFWRWKLVSKFYSFACLEHLICHCIDLLSFWLAWIWSTVGSLSTRVFETRTATWSELFSLLTFPHTTKFTLLSIFSPLEMNSIKIWETIRSKNANCSLPVAVRVSKTHVLKLLIFRNAKLLIEHARSLYQTTVDGSIHWKSHTSLSKPVKTFRVCITIVLHSNFYAWL